MKFQPEHFPKGTIVEINPPYLNFKEKNSVIFTVNEIRNAYGSGFLLVSTDKADSIGNKAYHVSHVKRIIKRGESSTVYGVSPPFKSIAKGKFISGHYLKDLLISLLGQNSHNYYDLDSLAKRFMSMYPGTNGKYSKKQLKRWFKQNHNRFAIKRDSVSANDNFMQSFLAQEDDRFYNQAIELFYALDEAEGNQVDIRKVILSVDDIAKYRKYGVEFKTFAFEKGGSVYCINTLYSSLQPFLCEKFDLKIVNDWAVAQPITEPHVLIERLTEPELLPEEEDSSPYDNWDDGNYSYID